MSLRIALVGAESTGKSTLAQALASALSASRAGGSGGQGSARGARDTGDTGLPGNPGNTPAWSVALVPETLREWCDREGRTPRAEEQRGIMREHHRRIEQAALQHDIVLCDTTALMTAVYSRTVFGDRSLDLEAVSLHRSMAATLLTALDLPWVADGLQRSGELVRQPVDNAVRELLLARGIAFSVITGSSPLRTTHALAAIAPALKGLRGQPGRTRPPLFSKLLAAQDGAAPQPQQRPPSHAAAWACTCCSVPELERALARGATPFPR